MGSRLADLMPGMLQACRSQFPKICGTCGAVYPTFRSFVARAHPLGAPKPDLIEDDDPIGLLSFANCDCGSTLALCYEDRSRHADFNRALSEELATSGRPADAVLGELVGAINAEGRQDPLSPVAAATGAIDPALLEVGAAIVEMVTRGSVHVPPYPAVALRVEEIVRRQRYGVDELARVVSSDQVLVAAVLQLANSALFSRGKVTALPMAIALVGGRELARLAIASGLGAHSRAAGWLMPVRSHVWNQSLTTAVICRVLGAQRGLSPDEGFVCGLLHDLGRMVTAINVEAFLERHPGLPARGLAWWMRVIDHFHVEVGGIAAERWDLPRLVRDVIALHHGGARARCEVPEMLDLVVAADAVALLAAQTAHLSAVDLAVLPSLRSDGERELLARMLPECPELIAAFEVTTGGGQQRVPSKISAQHPAVASRASLQRPLPGGVGVVNAVRPGDRYRLVALGPRQVVIEGRAPLQENLVAQLEVLLTPPLRFWATPSSCAAIGDEYRMELTLFALAREVQEHWLGFVEAQAAPATEPGQGSR